MGRPRRRHRTSLLAIRTGVLLRALFLLLAVQFAGVGHATADVVHAFASTVAEQREECPPDGPCDDCPSDCPNCHCTNAITSVVPEGVAPFALTLVESKLPRALSPSQRLPSPERTSLFRPPRA